MGGPDGEVGAAMRYLNQRYVAPCNEVKAILAWLNNTLSQLAALIAYALLILYFIKASMKVK